MSFPPSFAVAFALTILAMGALAFFGARATNAADFTLGGRACGAWSVAGAIMGTLVGGASTIGTAQIAFLFGLSGWWFTLGAGLSCLFMGLFLTGPLRDAQVETIPQFIAGRYGEGARSAASLFSSAGMFVHIVAQVLAGGAILTALFGFSAATAAIVCFALIALAVVGGGMKGAGPFGLAKLLLLYLTMAGAGIGAWVLLGGWEGVRALPREPWLSLFGYGTAAGINDLLSMLVGVVSTQTYLQAVFAARDRRAARTGAFLSALLIPPLGLFGVAVGVHMRQVAPQIESVQALPAFLHLYFPPVLAGAAFATLLLAAVGTAAGLALGVTTTLRLDVMARLRPGRLSELALYRMLTLAVLAAALLLVLGNLGSAIIAWSFLSMGLRGATLFLPLMAAIFLREAIPRRAVTLSIFIAPACVLAAGLIGGPGFASLYFGLGASLMIILGGRLLWGRDEGV